MENAQIFAAHTIMNNQQRIMKTHAEIKQRFCLDFNNFNRSIGQSSTFESLAHQFRLYYKTTFHHLHVEIEA